MEFLRSCYSSRWYLFRDNPTLSVPGRYYFCRPGTPHFPYQHFLGSATWYDRNITLEITLGEKADEARKWNQGAEPALVPPAAMIGRRDCFEQGERLPLPIVDREFIDGIDSRCFDQIDARELAWLKLSAIDRCTLQKFYAFIIDLMYANNEARIIELFQALIGLGYTIRFHRPRYPLPGITTIVTPDWSIAVVDGTRDFQQIAMQAFGSLGGPTNQGGFSSLQFWMEAVYYLHAQLVADGMVPGTKLTLVGHSYGGAAATIAAARYHAWIPDREMKLLTFGMPKLGDRRLQSLLNPIEQIHLCNDNDLVTILPPSFANIAPFLGVITEALGLAWDSWYPAPHRVRMDRNGELSAVSELIDDHAVLGTAILQALAGDPFASVTGHYIVSYFDRLDRRCPGEMWPTKPPIDQLEDIAIGSLGLPGVFPSAPPAAAGTLGLTAAAAVGDRGRGLALSGRELALGGLALTRPDLVPVSNLGAIALASPIPAVVDTVNTCSLCALAPRKWTFSLAGITNGTCVACATLNVTTILTYVSGCTWNGPLFIACAFAAQWKLDGLFPGGLWQLRCTLQTGDEVHYEHSLAGWDCLGPNVLTLTTAPTGCLNFPATITIFPV